MNKDNQKGVTVVIAMLILSSVVVLSVAVADLVLRSSRSSKEIGLSEVAYYAAESSIEQALYLVEKSNTVAGIDSVGALDILSDASWTRSYSLVNTLSTTCAILGSAEGLCVDSAGSISSANPLKVNLNAGSSFQLELNFSGMSLPSTMQIVWSGDAKVISLTDDDVVVDEGSPALLSNLSGNLYSLRIINEEATDPVTFTITPSANDFLPIGIMVTATGSYINQERTIEVERSNYQIY